jgi:H+/Cl- antiporter ClcA
MKIFKLRFEQWVILFHLLKWTAFVIPVSIVVGSLVALFLWLLDEVTLFRFIHPELIYFLPISGVFIYFLYHTVGKNSEAGNNLIIDEIHQPDSGVPARMAPLVLLTTLLTHLFGGSAGREGTAVQIGGSMASLWGKWIKINKEDSKILLMAGVAAGFGAVFGTPITGAIFALEVLAIGRIKYGALFPCLLASILADMTCSLWGIHHTHYSISHQQIQQVPFSVAHFDVFLLLKVLLAGVAFGLASYLFSELSYTFKQYSQKWVSVKWLIPFIGGLIIIGFTFIVGKNDYLGIGVTSPDPNVVTIVSAFHLGGADTFSWFWKLFFTAITLSMGFKGGEVTPLFFIGATLGNTLAVYLGAPIDLLAGLGFIAVFAGATNTPIACTMMGVELFGGEFILYYAIACFMAYYFSGHSGIYGSQRVAISKTDALKNTMETTLKEERAKRIK